MSQENVEIWRANLDGLLAELATGASAEATISRLAEIWDPEVELDVTDEGAALDSKGSTAAPTRLGSFGKRGSPPGKPTDWTTS